MPGRGADLTPDRRAEQLERFVQRNEPVLLDLLRLHRDRGKLRVVNHTAVERARDGLIVAL